MSSLIAAPEIAEAYQALSARAATFHNQFLQLLNAGAGGYASADDAFAALTSDGAGGATLSLGADGAIDFAGTAASQLTAANFRIG